MFHKLVYKSHKQVHKSHKKVCRATSFAECPTLDKMFFPNYLDMSSAAHSTNHLFVECCVLPSAALDKLLLCRVPDILFSANVLAFSKERVCGSDFLFSVFRYMQRKHYICSRKVCDAFFKKMKVQIRGTNPSQYNSRRK